ncbi:MAG TPA: S28 family serine protease [Kofleriaceae bacterium]
MNRVVGFIVAAMFAGSACGDNLGSSGMTHEQLLAKLRALQGVTAEEVPSKVDGFSAYVLHFTQPVDHNDPSGPTFQQEVSLLHRSELAPAPMVVWTSGYKDNYADKAVELTDILDANQVSIEHRFFGASRPAPADWTKLTIDQAAADEHEIIQALRTVYGGVFLSAGASKGGMTAVFHRRFYPGDVEGTVAYVAPLTFGAPDPRYPAFFDTVGPEDCRNAVRAIARDMLANRRDQMEARAALQTQYAYSRIPLGPAVEAAITGFEWSFWQYFGVDHCKSVPDVSASDDDVFAFLDRVSQIHESSDAGISDMEAYYYQSYAQLGYPDYTVSYLTPYLQYDEDDYLGELPTAEPAYDPNPMSDVLDYIDNAGDRLLFVYGEWDPWIKGKVVLGNAADSKSYTVPEGTHAASIRALPSDKCNAAAAMIENWTGVKPRLSWWRRAGSAPAKTALPLHMPPVLRHTPVARAVKR